MQPSNPAVDYDLAIIGAGAAGLAAAIFAGEKAQEEFQKTQAPIPRIVLIDGARRPGSKILVSGGGRCNVTNGVVTPEDYCGGSQKIIRNVLRMFDENRTVAWMESLGVPLKLETTGKYFPVSDSARTVLDALLNRLRALGIETRFGVRVADIRQAAQPASHWLILNASDNSIITATQIIVATGGRALPKSGSDGAAYPWLQRLGHTIIPTVPALAPLILDERGIANSPLSRHFADLSGITIDAILSYGCPGTRFTSFAGSTLFTHFGLSGPAPMNLSRHIARHRQENPGSSHGSLLISMSPELPSVHQADIWLRNAIDKWPRASITGALVRLMPERMAACLSSAIGPQRLTDLNRDHRMALARLISASPLVVKGDRGYSFAETTAGGVALDEISWRSMRSRKAEGLYLCGEVLDVDGRIGGFNFQWAWATGYIAGRAAI